MSKPKTAKVSTQPHFIRFRLVDENLMPITRSRGYVASWRNVGEDQPRELSGSSDQSGRTAVIETRGAANVFLKIAKADGGAECFATGHATSRPSSKRPDVVVKLSFAAKTSSAPAEENKCETFVVRIGKQQLRYVIDNVDSVINGLKEYSNYLQSFPYLIINTATNEVLSGSSSTGEAPSLFKGTKTSVSTDTVNVDGVAEVGLVLGASTDPKLWKRPENNLILYKVKPAAEGLTEVIITEEAIHEAAYAPAMSEAKPVNGSPGRHAGRLNGNVWAHFTPSYTIEEVAAMFNGYMTVTNEKGEEEDTLYYSIPSETQIAWAEKRGLSAADATLYRQQNLNRQQHLADPLRRGQPLPPSALPPLMIKLSWRTLLGHFYEGRTLREWEAYCKSEKPLPEYASPIGEGVIQIDPLDLQITLTRDFCENAYDVAGLDKWRVLPRNHPYIYMMLLEACARMQVNKVTLTGGWRPMLGSYLHKMGNALDVTQLDSKHDSLDAFNYAGGRVNALANKFNQYLHAHRYSTPNMLLYSGDAINVGSASDRGHKNHLHMTAEATKPVHKRDQLTPTENFIPPMLFRGQTIIV